MNVLIAILLSIKIEKKKENIRGPASSMSAAEKCRRELGNWWEIEWKCVEEKKIMEALKDLEIDFSFFFYYL